MTEIRHLQEQSHSQHARLRQLLRDVGVSLDTAFLEELRELDSLVAPETPEGGWRRLPKAYTDFRARLEGHENHENAVIQRAFEQDLSAGD